VDTKTMLVVATHVSQATNDMRELVPVLDKISALPADLGQVSSLLADTGYCSAANVQACEAQQIEPLLAVKRQKHNMAVLERFAPDAPAPERRSCAEDGAPTGDQSGLSKRLLREQLVRRPEK
jgi:hypothetical protein